jgi:tricorn protease
MKHLNLVASAAIALAAPTLAAEQTLMLEDPAISTDRLAFVYAGDIWIANRDGSAPRRLTSDPASEYSPLFSPDGSHIAYVANYDGSDDVYVVPTAGGQARRLTWHPGDDVPTGWTADGSGVTFVSTRETDHGRSGQMFVASLAGGLPQKQMEARVYRGVYNADGSQLAYIPFGSGYNGLFRGTSGWRGYRGGTTPAIHLFDVKAETVAVVPGGGATNFNPLWLGEQLYFISDREEGQFNIFHYDPGTSDLRRISSETTWDVQSAGGHGSTLVYAAGGRLMELDPASGASTEIKISIRPDLPELRRQWKDASKTVQAADISPTGKRAIVTARGEVFTVPVEDGSTRNISLSPGVREYGGLWSPDGMQIAYIVESLQGQTLVIAPQSGIGERREIKLGPHFYELLAWGAGDAGRIVFQDNHLNLFALDTAGGTISKVATDVRREPFEVAISPDGAWLAYTHEQPNFYRDLVLYHFASGARHRVSDGSADVAAPAFSRDGKYLYFAASTNSGPLQVGLNMSSQERPYRAGLYAAVLAADSASPLAPKAGDEEAQADKKADDAKDKPPAITRVDPQGIAERIVALPVAEANYSNLAAADDGKLYFLQSVQPGATVELPGKDENSANAILRFDFEKRESASLLQGVEGFVLSADGKHLLINKVDGSLATTATGDELEPEPLDLAGLRVNVEPRVEWAQIFDEAWRMEKEYFYDPNLHGLNWQAVYDRYRPLVAHVGRRTDLNRLLVSMIAELGVGHNRVGGGDVYRPPTVATGLLGANFTINDGRYQVKRVYSGELWNPALQAPLAKPGNSMRAGEYLLAINGQELLATDNIFERLQGTVGKQLTLRVAARANGRESRELVVEPVDSERMLRLWHWVESNRRRVDEASDGRVGYVYLPNTAGAGFTFFNRMFFAQLDRDALIIDERSNAGGQAANYITDVLSRRHLSGWKDRDGLVYNTPAGALHGPKVMLIDQDAGSGGDFLPYSFRQLGIGKLLGTRTWGGLIGIAANPDLMDGGSIVVPFFRFYDANHRWSIENEGVAPDIVVALDPVATNRGRDSQLERGIEEVLRELERFVDPVPDTAPPYPREVGQ